MNIRKIKFERTGGFAGIRVATEIEIEDLPEEQRNEILELLDDMDFEELPAKLSGGLPVSDEFVYSIVVEAGEEEYQIVAGESALPQDLQSLIELLEKQAKRRLRKKD
ncbi:MAG: hypothetical protein HXY42_04425 [Chloroflexi bacterium]|nr:hypothetical protein [Chloroflexota bacterium]